MGNVTEPSEVPPKWEERPETQSFETFSFAQLADTQIGMRETFDNEPPGWDEEIRLLDLAIGEINRIRPKFAIICGDLVDQFPDAPNPTKRRRQIKEFKNCWKRSKVPLVCVCGNHDVGNAPSAKSIRKYKRDFGKDYFAFWVSGVKCLVLNSQLWKDDSNAKDLRRKQDEWLHDELASPDTSEAKYVLAFCHIPPFLFSRDEPNGYFNLEQTTRKWLLDLLSHHKVRKVFCGHYHRNAGGWYDQQLEVVTTGAVGTNVGKNPDGDPLGLSGMGKPALGDDVSGLRLVHVGDSDITHEWHTMTDLRNVKEIPSNQCPQWIWIIAAIGVASGIVSLYLI